MYITITAQSLGEQYSQSVSDFVSYLEKENEGKEIEEMEFFFDQYGEHIEASEVIREIDHNTAKLKRTEPKFYSITVNPSRRELSVLTKNSEDLKRYTREIMKDYAASFNREINGRQVNVDDIKYYAKIEHSRVYKNLDKAVQENLPFHKKILALRNKRNQLLSDYNKGPGNNNKDLVTNTAKINDIEKQISELYNKAPHKIDGVMIISGMPKPGAQSHVHVIVSRKDVTNSYSLSPGSRYRSSETIFNGKTVKRGFDRNLFYERAERTFDRLLGYQRNYVESYTARKTFKKHPEKYFSTVMGLSFNEKVIAARILNESGISTAVLNIPTSKVQLAIKTFKQLKKGLDIAIRSSSIGI